MLPSVVAIPSAFHPILEEMAVVEALAVADMALLNPLLRRNALRLNNKTHKHNE